jgi:hypothetical protein
MRIASPQSPSGTALRRILAIRKENVIEPQVRNIYTK